MCRVGARKKKALVVVWEAAGSVEAHLTARLGVISAMAHHF